VQVRQGDEGSAGVAWDASTFPPLNVENELVFRCDGDDVTAELNGRPVPVQADRKPRRGRLRLECVDPVEGLRILGIDRRPLPPPAPPAPPRTDPWTIGVTPSLSRGLGLVWVEDGDYETTVEHGAVCYSLIKNQLRPLRYLYAAVQDRTFLTIRSEVLVDYFDEGTGGFGLEYDGLKGAYFPSYERVRLENSKVWKTARFILLYPAFRGRQNGRSDLRLVRDPDGPLKVRGIRLEYHRVQTARPMEGPLEKPAGAQPGVRFEYFEGSWEWVELFQSQTPVLIGVTEAFDLSRKRRDEDFALRFTGYLQIPRDGTYTFSTLSDDGSTLLLGGKLVVANDGLHAPEEQSGTVTLRAGYYPITVNFLQGKVGALLEVTWSGPGFPKQIIPATALFHVDAPK
jgi:hypothetical protein